MKIDLFRGLLNKNREITERYELKNFQKELSNKLKNMEEKITVDRFEGNIAVCENRETGEILKINKSELPKEVKEGNIVKKINGEYVIDIEENEKVSKRIEEKMNRLWK